MELKEKIQAILEKKNYTYKALAEYLGVTESDLDLSLESRTLEIRVLEVISKELRIPLYSFFRDTFNVDEVLKEPYYNTSLWANNETQYLKEIKLLRDEIAKLKLLLLEKDSQIGKLQTK